jgi:hypothetical protein
MWKLGLDLGYTEGGVLIWTVFAPAANLIPGALAGTYAGGTASATVGVGVGANGLIGGSCVDGPRPARDFNRRGAVVACSHVSGPLTQPGWTAGPDGFRESSAHHSNGIGVPMNRQASLDCVGSTGCTITLHFSRKLEP